MAAYAPVPADIIAQLKRRNIWLTQVAREAGVSVTRTYRNDLHEDELGRFVSAARELIAMHDREKVGSTA